MFKHHYKKLTDLTMHYVTAGEGKKILVLLHGYPQSWYCWREVISLMGGEYTIIAPDLRGLGDTTRPSEGYDKRTIAKDVVELLDTLGISKFAVVGHDWGGVVAFAVAADNPRRVTHLGVVDVAIPGDGQPNIGQSGRRWHHSFLQTLDLPEALIEGREEYYFDWFFENYGRNKGVISRETRDEYMRNLTTPGALRAGFAYYREVTKDIRDNQARTEKLTIPVLAFGGGEEWGRGEEVAKSLRRMAVNVTEIIAPESGHWVPEEEPEMLSQAIKDLLSSPSDVEYS